ncbi:hypothetical protein B0H10DRAFT_1952536 [Mycena sp. CBHHK59/15]|nr:hypothetical protein B0H10DRAFT_1952536 [Mycena sp. CBHHK59/15]
MTEDLRKRTRLAYWPTNQASTCPGQRSTSASLSLANVEERWECQGHITPQRSYLPSGRRSITKLATLLADQRQQLGDFPQVWNPDILDLPHSLSTHLHTCKTDEVGMQLGFLAEWRGSSRCGIPGCLEQAPFDKDPRAGRDASRREAVSG